MNEKAKWDILIVALAAAAQPVMAQNAAGGSDQAMTGSGFTSSSMLSQSQNTAGGHGLTMSDQNGTGGTTTSSSFVNTAPPLFATSSASAANASVISGGRLTGFATRSGNGGVFVNTSTTVQRTTTSTSTSQPTSPMVTHNPGGNNTGNASSYDRRFLLNAAEGSLTEVAMGGVAQTNTSNSAVMDLANALVTDHTTSYNDAVTLAQSLGITVPDALSRSDSRQVASLARTSATRFDRQFVTHEITDHQRDIQTFSAAAQRASNPDVRAFARAQLPVLTKHLVLALQALETLQ